MELSLSPDSRKLERLGDFAILRVIGEGGMGIVYEALEQSSGRRVALKVLHTNLSRSEGARERFFTEMRVTAGLSHPNIVRSLSSAEIEGKLVMVLELCEGHNLREELSRGGRLPWQRALVVASAVAAALVAAHESAPAIVHRDLKPENLMLLANGGVKVMDFGIAKVLSEDAARTRTTQTVGTVQYMSPEQINGGAITPSVDLYALGLVLYEMVAGHPPFDSPSLLALLRAQCESPPPPLPDVVRREIPAELEQLLLGLLDKRPGARPKSARAVLDVLLALRGPAPAGAATAFSAASAAHHPTAPHRQAASAPTSAPRLDTMALVDKLDRRARWPWLVGAGLLIAAGSLVASKTIWLQSRDSEEAEDAEESDDEPLPDAKPVAPPPKTPPLRGPCAMGSSCVAFAPKNPREVELEQLVSAADGLARSVDPSAQLANLTVMKALGGGRLDLGNQDAMVVLTYRSISSMVLVRASATELGATRADATQGLQLVTRDASCTFKRAYDVALGTEFKNAPDAFASLIFNPQLGLSVYQFHGPTGHALIDAKTCTVRTRSSR